jgi:hypothetical protein
MLRRKSKPQFVKQERNKQNAIALLNCLKRFAPQQLMLRMQVFTQKLKAQITSTGHNYHAIRAYLHILHHTKAIHKSCD